ncbi:hypothetical protein ABT407_39505, partial [Streptomyces eurythermus]
MAVADGVPAGSVTGVVAGGVVPPWSRPVAVANCGSWVAVGGREVLEVSSGGAESAVSVGVMDGEDGVWSGDRDGGSDTEAPGAGVVVGVGAGLDAGRGGAAGRSSVGPCGHSVSA